MADKSKIEWTDASWTPIRARNRATGKVGWHCEHASPGCLHCYSEGFNEKRLGTGLPFKPGHSSDVEHFLDEEMLLAPLRWKKPRQIFVCSMTDLFGLWVTDAWIDRVFAVMALCPQHTFQVLTKRSARMRAYLSDPDLNNRISAALGCMLDGDWIWNKGKRFRNRIECMIDVFLGESSDDEGEVTYHDDPMPLPNVWLGVSAEDQKRADERVPDLLATPATIRFVSAEPLLGPIDFRSLRFKSGDDLPEVMRVNSEHGSINALSGISTWPASHYQTTTIAARGRLEGAFWHEGQGEARHLDWIIVGGESGAGARPMHPAWARSIRDQCQAAGVAFFHKQNGAWKPTDDWYADHPVSLPIRAWTGAEWTDDGSRDDLEWFALVGKKAAGRLLDGREHNAMPAVRSNG